MALLFMLPIKRTVSNVNSLTVQTWDGQRTNIILLFQKKFREPKALEPQSPVTNTRFWVFSHLQCCVLLESVASASVHWSFLVGLRTSKRGFQWVRPGDVALAEWTGWTSKTSLGDSVGKLMVLPKRSQQMGRETMSVRIWGLHSLHLQNSMTVFLSF